MSQRYDNTEPWQLTEINHPVQCQQITVTHGNNAAEEVLHLRYTHSGAALFALRSDGTITVWKWPTDEQNPSGKATTRVLPQQFKPEFSYNGSPTTVFPQDTENMTNDYGSGGHHNNPVPCLTLSRNDHYVISAYGGEASLFFTDTFKFIAGFMTPPPAIACVEFYPNDNNIIAVGFENSTVVIYHVRQNKVIAILEGHQRGAVTSLAFSSNLGILVSSGSDDLLCVWNTNIWSKVMSVPVNMLCGVPYNGETAIEFHPDRLHLLVTQEMLLAVYDASRMELVSQWSPQNASMTPITCTTYSGDGQLVYVCLHDGDLWVLEGNTLKPRCKVASSAYRVAPEVNGSEGVYPLTIAANPHERNQFAIGLTNGSIRVLEPLASEGEWGKSPPSDH